MDKIYLPNIYNEYETRVYILKATFPKAVEVTSSHIGGIRISNLRFKDDFTDWFQGFIMSVDRSLSIDGKRHAKYIRLLTDPSNGKPVAWIGYIRKCFLELRKYLPEKHQAIDYIWEVPMQLFISGGLIE